MLLLGAGEQGTAWADQLPSAVCVCVCVCVERERERVGGRGREMEKTRYVVLNCEDAEKWKGHEELFVRTFDPSASAVGSKAAARKWEVFNCCEMQVPKPEEAHTVAVVLITGSRHDCWRDEAWILAACDFVRAAVDAGARTLGVCFGCQLLGRALGGTVGRNPSSKFVLGLERIVPTPALFARRDFAEAVCSSRTDTDNVRALRAALASTSTASSSTHLKVLESHGDQVVVPPPGATLLASSSSTEYELWAIETETKHVLAMQFHPELWPAIVMEKIAPAIQKNGKLNAEEVAHAARELDANSLDSSIIVAMARDFLGFRDSHTPSGTISQKMDNLFCAVSDAVDAELALVRHDYELVGRMNAMAAQKYNEMADFTAQLSQFASSIAIKMNKFTQYEGVVTEMEQQLFDLEAIVTQLDSHTSRLEAKISVI